MHPSLITDLSVRRWASRAIVYRVKAYLAEMRAALARGWQFLLLAGLLFPQLFTLRQLASPLLTALAAPGLAGWLTLLALHGGGIALAMTQARAVTGGALGVFLRTLPLSEKQHWRGTVTTLALANLPLWAYLILCFMLGRGNPHQGAGLGPQLMVLGQSVLLSQACWLHGRWILALPVVGVGAALPLLLAFWGEQAVAAQWLGASVALALAWPLQGSDGLLALARRAGSDTLDRAIEGAPPRHRRIFPRVRWPAGWRIVHAAMWGTHRGFTLQRLLLAALPPYLALLILRSGGAEGAERGLAVIATGAMAWPLGALFKQLRAHRRPLDLYLSSLPMRVSPFWARIEITCVALMVSIAQGPFLLLMLWDGVLRPLDVIIVWPAFLGLLAALWALARLEGGWYVVLLTISVWPWSALVVGALP